MSIEALGNLIDQKYVFHCTPRGGETGARDFEVLNTRGRPLTGGYVPGWVPRSLKAIYREWDGLRLFESEPDSLDGFRLFEFNDCAVHLRMLREVFAERRGCYQEESSLDANELITWLDGLVPIGEILASGDVYVLDTANPDDDGECPVYFLDHEHYYGGNCDPECMDIVAPTVVGLLEDVLEDPLKHVAGNWCGNDPERQWFPDSCTISG